MSPKNQGSVQSNDSPHSYHAGCGMKTSLACPELLTYSGSPRLICEIVFSNRNVCGTKGAEHTAGAHRTEKGGGIFCIGYVKQVSPNEAVGSRIWTGREEPFRAGYDSTRAKTLVAWHTSKHNTHVRNKQDASRLSDSKKAVRANAVRSLCEKLYTATSIISVPSLSSLFGLSKNPLNWWRWW